MKSEEIRFFRVKAFLCFLLIAFVSIFKPKEVREFLRLYELGIDTEINNIIDDLHSTTAKEE